MKIALLLLPLQVLSLVTDASWFYNKVRPLVICNGGCSGHFPENSNASYTDAFLNGADFVGITVHATRDGVLVVNEDICLKASTNANATWYGNLKAPKNESSFQINNETLCTQDWVIPNLNWTSGNKLKRIQRYPSRSQYSNGVYPVMNLNDTLTYIEGLNERYNQTNRTLGLSIQIVYADWYNTTKGIDIINKTFSMLASHNLSNVANSTAAGVPIMIQSPDFSTLQAFANLTDLPLVQTIFSNGTYDYDSINTIASAVRPELDLIY